MRKGMYFPPEGWKPIKSGFLSVRPNMIKALRRRMEIADAKAKAEKMGVKRVK